MYVHKRDSHMTYENDDGVGSGDGERGGDCGRGLLYFSIKEVLIPGGLEILLNNS